MKPISETDLEQLSAYIDGELSDSERRFFQKRLAADAGLRAACERAWIASSILKSQPIQLMPASCADAICAGCEDATETRGRWRLVASFAAVAVAFGLGMQLLPSDNNETLAPTRTAQVTVTPSAVTEPTTTRPLETPQLAKSVPALPKPAQRATAAVVVAGSSDDPSAFTLNEAVLAKSWPQRDAAMQGYLVRHNQMAGNAAGNDLISYAELLAEPQPEAQVPEQEGR